MKRILLTFAAVSLMLAANAQMMFQRSIELPSLSSKPDSAAVADSLWWAEQPRLSLSLGLSAGVTLFNSDNEATPYYSRQGLVLELPLLLGYRVSPHWRLATGVQVDLHYNPLHYNVDLHMVDDGNGYSYADGLDFGNYARSAYSDGKQHAYTFFGYIGIPLQATWYPWAREQRLLAVNADLFAGYAFATNLGLKASYAERNSSGGVGYDETGGVAHHAPSLQPWKLQLGVTLSTDVLGLLHGVRFFVNLLPSYRDPLSGDGIYLHGMTLYL